MQNKDTELVQKILSGDREAFDSFYKTYFQKVYNSIYLQLQDHSITEDLTQEVFVSMIESLEHFEGKSSLLCWIYGITRNIVHNWFRTKKREIVHLQGSEDSYIENFYCESANPLTNVEYQEFLLACNNKLQKLDSESREIFLEKHFNGLSIKEIAKKSHKSPGSIKTTLYRTKMLLLQEN